MKLIFSLLLFIISVSAFAADPLQITTTIDKTNILTGETAQVSVLLKNPNAPLAPIVLQATASWEDVYGNKYTAVSNKVSLKVQRPIKVETVGIPIDVTKIDYVTNSAYLADKQINAVLTNNVVNLYVNTSLLEWTKITAKFTIVGK